MLLQQLQLFAHRTSWIYSVNMLALPAGALFWAGELEESARGRWYSCGGGAGVGAASLPPPNREKPLRFTLPVPVLVSLVPLLLSSTLALHVFVLSSEASAMYSSPPDERRALLREAKFLPTSRKVERTVICFANLPWNYSRLVFMTICPAKLPASQSIRRRSSLDLLHTRMQKCQISTIRASCFQTNAKEEAPCVNLFARAKLHGPCRVPMARRKGGKKRGVGNNRYLTEPDPDRDLPPPCRLSWVFCSSAGSESPSDLQSRHEHFGRC